MLSDDHEGFIYWYTGECLRHSVYWHMIMVFGMKQCKMVVMLLIMTKNYLVGFWKQLFLSKLSRVSPLVQELESTGSQHN